MNLIIIMQNSQNNKSDIAEQRKNYINLISLKILMINKIIIKYEFMTIQKLCFPNFCHLEKIFTKGCIFIKLFINFKKFINKMYIVN